jgi:hypothetical protein
MVDEWQLRLLIVLEMEGTTLRGRKPVKLKY